MKTLILQNVSTKEIRTVVQAVALADKNEYYIIRSDIDDLEKYSEELRSAIPVGSVEFVRKAMEIAKNEDTKRIAGKSVTIFEKYLDDMMKEEKK